VKVYSQATPPIVGEYNYILLLMIIMILLFTPTRIAWGGAVEKGAKTWAAIPTLDARRFLNEIKAKCAAPFADLSPGVRCQSACNPHG
jgi:hypothetical protein